MFEGVVAQRLRRLRRDEPDLARAYDVRDEELLDMLDPNDFNDY